MRAQITVTQAAYREQMRDESRSAQPSFMNVL